MAMEKDKFSYNSYSQAINKIYKAEGVRGFYRGYFCSVIGIIVYHGCSFFIFTRIKEFIKDNYPHLFRLWYVDFLVGAVSSAGQFVAYPFDMIKKRMQGQSLLAERGEIDRPLNYIEMMRKMNSEGIKSYYKGCTVNLVKAPLSLAISWTMKNIVNRYLDELYDL
jgi:hypothetical protein